MNLPTPLKRLIDRLAELPSIGPRQATRLTFYLLARGQQSLQGLAEDIASLQGIKTCERCFFLHQNADGLCDICRNPARKKELIMIVEKETDLLSIENTHKFDGRYFILGPISKTGMLDEKQKLRIQSLKATIQKESNGQVEEIILGFNPTTLGDFQASILMKELAASTKKISRLGRGLPTGGEIEFADDETLGSALDRRG